MKYNSLAQLFSKLESISARLQKTYHISSLIRTSKSDEVDILLLMIQGRIYPQWDKRHSGVAARLVLKGLNTATGIPLPQIESKWKKTGDLGEVAANLVSISKQQTLLSEELTLQHVFSTLRKLSKLEGKGTVSRKLQLINSLLTSAKPIEAKYITRTVLEDLRIGVGEGTLRDALAWAFLPKVNYLFTKCPSCKNLVPKKGKCSACEEQIPETAGLSNEAHALKVETLEDIFKADLASYSVILAPDEKTAREIYNTFINAIQEAFDVKNDFGMVAKTLKTDGFGAILNPKIEIGRPIKVMLAQKVRNIEEGFKTVGEPCDIEYKYDGFRMQIHKSEDEVIIFTRRLEDVTKQFPEVVKVIRENSNFKSMVLDCEAIGYDAKTKIYQPFQHISQRIRRKYDINQLMAKLPVEVNAFDILYCEGENMIREPFAKRRNMLEKAFLEKKWSLVKAKNIRTSETKSAEKFYQESLKMGNEGVMLKALDAPYKPGSRVGFMVKLKPIMDTLDLVIIGAEWGEGKRSRWLSSFSVACIDDEGLFRDIGKVGTGFKEKEAGVTFDEMTMLLKPLITKEEGRKVQVTPEIVIEVSFEEIQQSTAYSSGFALRFPRIVKLRADRSPNEISSLEMVESQYNTQR